MARRGSGRVLAALAALTAAGVAAAGCQGTSEAPDQPAPTTIRVAVVGGLIDTGLWPVIALRYQRLTGHQARPRRARTR